MTMNITRRKRGEVRADGFRFGFYYRRRGRLREEEAWLNPEAYKKWAEQTQAAVRKLRARKRAERMGINRPLAHHNKMSTSEEIIGDKQLRVDTDAIIQRLKALPPSRERALAITKFQEGVMWLGMDLKRINEKEPGSVENPYPNSKNPSNTKIEPTADGMKL